MKLYLPIALLLITQNSIAQSFPESFSEDMKAQFFTLSDKQKESIASQYDIDLSSISQKSSSPSTGSPNAGSPNNYQVDQRFNSDQISNKTYDQSLIPQQQDYPMIDVDGKPVVLDDPSNVHLKRSNRFGVSIFNNQISTFSPFEDIPISDDYVLGSGDELSIKLVGSENSSMSLIIERNGTIFIPQIGEINVSGLIFKDAVNLIQSRIEQELIGVNVFVTMGRIKSINVFISGEVNSPGMYSLSSMSTISQSLYQAGGITDIGSLRSIKLLRNGVQHVVFDTYDLLIYGISSSDIRLRSGDVVLVPPYEGVVEIKGSVKRPYQFEIKSGDTFKNLLSWSGGFDEDAYPLASTLTRSNSIGEIANVSNFNFLLSDNLNNDLLNNDLIVVPEDGMGERNYVTIEGAINRSGKYGWSDGMRISDIFSNNNDYLYDFTNNTDFSIGLVERFNQPKKNISFLDFSPDEILNNENSKSNIHLQEFDRVYFLPKNLIDRFLLIEPIIKRIYKFSNDSQLNFFTIKGDVKFPGQYPLPPSISLRQAIMLAGGANDTAFMDSIEIVRSEFKNDGKISTAIYEVANKDQQDEAKDFLIKSRDKITIRKNIALDQNYSFTLNGFVNFPGTYPFTTGDTLSMALERAGGLKVNAFPEGTRLIRKSLIESQTKQNKLLAASIRSSYASSILTSENNPKSINDIESVARIIEQIDGEGRLVIDLNKAISGENEYNISLEDGDTIFIPQKTTLINIIGEVRNPNTVNYIQNLDTEDYINLAGGFSKRADIDNLYIIRANGSIVTLKKSFFSLGLNKPVYLPGDTLVVPIKQNYQNPLPLWSQVTQIIYQSMVSLAAVKGL